MKKPKVSAVVPSYNHGLYLRRRLDSVFNQTFTDMEIILLDDASKDDCAAIMAEYAKKDPRVSHFIVNKKNSGSPFIQWKKGADLACGEYLWIAESDDWAELTLLEKLVPMLDADPSLGYVYCDTQVHGYPACKLTSEFNNQHFHTDRWSHNHRNKGVDEIRDYMVHGNTIMSGSGVLYRTDVIKRMNAIDTRFRYVGDMYTFFKIMIETDLEYLAEPLNCYQHHAKNITKEGYENGRSALEMIAAYGPILHCYAPQQQDQLIDSLVKGFEAAFQSLDLTLPAVWKLIFSELFSSSPILRKVLWRMAKAYCSRKLQLLRPFVPPVFYSVARSMTGKSSAASSVATTFDGMYASIDDVPLKDVKAIYKNTAIVKKLKTEAENDIDRLRNQSTLLPAPIQTSESPNLLPELVAILAANKQQPVRVLDFGGGLATGYRNCLRMLPAELKFEFVVVELPELVITGNSLFAHDSRVVFTRDIPKEPGQFDIVSVGSSLQYISDYKSMLRALAAIGAEYFFFTDTLLYDGPTYATRQNNFAEADSGYWVFNYQEISGVLAEHGYKRICASANTYMHTYANVPESNQVANTINIIFRRTTN